MMGLTATMDKDLTDGFIGWALEKITGKHYDRFDLVESLEDYYLGRVIGHVISLLAGIGSMIKGVMDIIAAIGAGGAITLGTGGLGAVGGGAIAIGGVVIGAAEISYGGAVVYAASGNFKEDFNKLLDLKNNTNNWNHRDKYLKMVQNKDLYNAIDQLYRKGAKIGDGGTADILRHEFDNGLPLKHLQKAQDMIQYLNNILSNQNLSPTEIKLAYQLLNDLYDAVKYVR